MFTKYVYKAGAKTYNIKNDLEALLTGETTASNLSSDCDTVNTEIISDIAAGWESQSIGHMGALQYDMPVTGYYKCEAVNRGSTVVWPVLGSQNICRSTSNGDPGTFSAVTFYAGDSLSDFTVTLGSVKNLAHGTVSGATKWVMTNPGVASPYIYISTDDCATFTRVDVGQSLQWHTPVFVSTLGTGTWVITPLDASNAKVLYSTDHGVTWAVATITGTGASNRWGTPVWNGVDRFVMVPGNIAVLVSNNTYFATSTNGSTWATGASGWSNGFSSFYVQYENGMWLVSAHPSVTSAYIATSSNGTTFTSRALPSTSYWLKPVYANSTWVIGANTASVGIYSSSDGTTWVSRRVISNASTLGYYYNTSLSKWVISSFYSTAFYLEYSTDLSVWVSNINTGFGIGFLGHSYFFMATCVDETFLLNIYGWIYYSFFSSNTSDFLLNQLNLTAPQQPLPNYSFSSLIVNGLSKKYFIPTSVSTAQAFVIGNNLSNFTVRGINSSISSTKKVTVEVGQGVSLLTSETNETNSLSKVALNSGSSLYGYGTSLDYTNGGVIFLGATSSYIFIMGYKPTGSSWSYASFVSDFSRDDGWNVAGSYPTHGWGTFFLSSSTDGFYAVRAKTAYATDVSSVVLPLFIADPFSKQSLNADNNVVPACIDIRVYNFTTYSYGILGGILLGNFLQTVTSLGSTGDTITIGSDNYFVIANTASPYTRRFLVKKA